MRTAIVHDWLVSYAGSERVLEQIIAMYPEADLYSLVDFIPGTERNFIQNKIVHTSFIQHLPFARKKYRSYLPFMPLAIEQFDLSQYDLVLSSSHAVAKGALTSSNQVHICYCHTPMRYAWDLYHQYLKESGLNKGLKGKLAQLILHYIRMWDHSSSQRVDHFIANSRYIAARIKKNYGREAVVIYPPVDVEKYQLQTKKEDYYVTASRMVPYKKVDLIVEAFSSMPDKKLVVIGDGPDLGKVKAKAGKNIELLGHQPTAVLKEHLQKAKAFIFAAEEDFGILPVEAQACGTPVIAFGKGGVLETVIPLQNVQAEPVQNATKMEMSSPYSPTGVFFHEQTTASLITAVREFENAENLFDSCKIRNNAERFSKERFQSEFKHYVDNLLPSS